MSRGTVIVDGPSLHAMSLVLGRRVDYPRLLTALRGLAGDPDASGLYFTSVVSGVHTLDPLFESLSRTGFSVVIQRAHSWFRPGTNRRVVRGSVDVNLVLGAVRAVEAGSNSVVLVSGNGGFVSLVEDLQQRGATVAVVSPLATPTAGGGSFTSAALIKAASVFYDAAVVDALWEHVQVKVG